MLGMILKKMEPPTFVFLLRACQKFPDGRSGLRPTACWKHHDQPLAEIWQMYPWHGLATSEHPKCWVDDWEASSGPGTLSLHMS